MYDFWSLRLSQRRDIIQSLGLLEQKDWLLSENERYRKAFSAAKERDKISELIEAVDKAKNINQ